MGLSAIVVVAAGCATSKSPLNDRGPEHWFVLLRLEPGSLAFTSSLEPASFSFKPGQGRLESAGEGAARAARAILTTPNLIHPQLEAAAGAVEFVLAPFAAGYGALSAGHRRLPAEKLAEADEELTQAMRSMAGQERLRELLLQCAGEKTRRRLLPLAPAAAPGESSELVSAVVQTTVESLRLERAGTGDNTYALCMKARASVVRAADRAVVFDRHYEFHSDEAMFIDWARAGGFESVAQTGYRALAEQMAQDLFVAPAGRPVRVGPSPAVFTSSNLSANSSRSIHTRLAQASFRTSRPDRELANEDRVPGIEFTVLRAADNGSLEIYSGRAMSDLLIQRPPAKEEAIAEASTETEWLLGGLENDRNAVVQAVACLAAVPFGLWEQTVGLLRPHDSEELELAERNLKTVARRMQPHQILADAVARALAPRTSQSIALVKDPLLMPGANESLLIQCSYHLTPSGFANSEPGTGPLTARGAGTALEIHLVQARLARMPGLRSRLALSFEAQVELIRKSDGQELYSFPVAYRSAGKPLKAWVGGDAEMFRRELRDCCREMGKATAEVLVSSGLVPPPSGTAPVLAQR
ncbi:MAG TPA: hypothetical protein VNZ64_18585 [Candidatus Acidoferrum sp.]|jgi:hypothetical protein|nr:hypothetical protein [Candidatus Acidoferrum sp.]